VLASSPGVASSRNTERRPRPSIEAARRRLGGRQGERSILPPGSLVEVRLSDGTRRPAVLLWGCPSHCDVWLSDGEARRTGAEAVVPSRRAMPQRFARVSAELRLFSALVEGERVRWQRVTGVTEGRIVEKCRYGAIVVTGDGRFVAVGFRKLWPALVRAIA
jgi:hypothetical protein